MLAALALVVLILVVVGSRLQVSYRTPLTGCARDNGTGGASGVYRWADRIGIPVRLLDVPLHEATRSLPGPSGNCVLTMGDGSWPSRRDDKGPTNWLGTRDWLSRGNALIVVTTDPKGLPRDLLGEPTASSLKVLGAEAGFSGDGESAGGRVATAQAPVKGGGVLTVRQGGPRWGIAPTAKDGPGASSRRIDPAALRLAADPRGGVLFRFPVGHGAVYVLLDDYAWTNSGLDQGDNARVLAEILGREVRGGVLAFDEDRHGHGRIESFLTYLLDWPGATAFVWLAVAWSLLYLYGRNVRLRPAEPYVERERRTAQEAIDAVAQLYERARAAPLVVEAVARRLRQVSRTSAEAPRSLQELLHAAEHYTKTNERPARPTAAIRLVRDLIQLRKRIYGTRTVS